MGEGEEDQKLRNATLSSLKVADQEGLRSLSFPVDRCASTMLGAVVDYLKGSTGLNHVVFCLFSADVLAVFQKEMEGLAQSGFSIQK